MGQKYTSEDLFRIANEHLSDVERQEFIFLCTTSTFRETIGAILGGDVDISNDERNLLERIFTKFRSLTLTRGTR